MKNAPLSRRHLGDYELRTKSGDVVKFAVFVNAATIAHALSQRAAGSKSKRAYAMFGGVLVEMLS